MTLEQINAIEDYGLRNIRMKYWNLKHQAFLDEHGIPDHLLEKTWDELSIKEEQEVTEYLLAKSNT